MLIEFFTHELHSVVLKQRLQKSAVAEYLNETRNSTFREVIQKSQVESQFFSAISVTDYA